MPYRVFLNAPSIRTLKKAEGQSFTWSTVRSRDEGTSTTQDVAKEISSGASFSIVAEDSTLDGDTRDWILPPATFDAASQRISDMYKNVIFPPGGDSEEDWDKDEEGEEIDETCNIDEDLLISWPPTNPGHSRSRTSFSRALSGTRAEISEETSYAHTSTSSITAFPTFVINLHTLTSLSELIPRPSQSKWSQKVNLLAAILEVDGPNVVRIKKGPNAGRDVSVLRLVLSGEEGIICKLTAWREVADSWSGGHNSQPDDTSYESEGVKRGDIVYLENILASVSSYATAEIGVPKSEYQVVLTASPNLSSHLHICYRTLPTTASDRRFRPDLRLATSDPGLRKVANVVHWLEHTMGIN